MLYSVAFGGPQCVRRGATFGHWAGQCPAGRRTSLAGRARAQSGIGQQPPDSITAAVWPPSALGPQWPPRRGPGRRDKPFGATAMACAPWPLACPLNGYWLAGIEAAVVHLMPFNRHVHARADQLETLALFASLTKSKNALHLWGHGPRVCPRHGTKVDLDKSLKKCPNLAIYIFLFWWLFWAGIDCFTFHELTFEYRKPAGTNGQPLSLRFVFRTFG